MSDITLGQYYHADSPIHRLDPRIKLVLTIIYLVCVFLVDHLYGYAILFAYLYMAVRLSKVPFKKMIRSIRPLLFLLVFTSVLNVFLIRTGTPIFEWWIIKITKEGLYKAVFMALRLVFLVTGTSLMTLTTTPIALTDGLEQVLSPLRIIKFPAHELAMMMSIALRFIPTLVEETDKIRKAQLARGADFESGNLLRRAKAMIPILVPLFVSAFRRADELAMAMESRCYNGGEGRTRMNVLKTHKRDYVAIASMAILAVILFFWG